MDQKQTIIHVDMDAFYAAVEMRDNAELRGKPLIIGALPHERGVVCTCSYEARKFGVRSAMSIKEAARLCPDGIYMRPNMEKYQVVSAQIHEIWADYTNVCEYLSLDEGFLDVTMTAHAFGGAAAIAHEIRARTEAQTGVTCSVGVGYSMMSAKLASEEKKPNGFFEIPDAAALRELIMERSVRVIYGVGAKTAEKLARHGIITVRDIYENPSGVIATLGNYGAQIVELAQGTDRRRVQVEAPMKSLGKEHTLQEDTMDWAYLNDMLLVIAERLGFELCEKELYARTVTLKLSFSNMQTITRAKSGAAARDAAHIYQTAAELLDAVERRPIRLIGITVSGFSEMVEAQTSLFDQAPDGRKEKLQETMMGLKFKYGKDIVKPVRVLEAEMRISKEREEIE